MYCCRICGTALREVLDLGRQPSANRFLLPHEVEQEHLFRLALGRCEACTMVQLLEGVPQEIRYHDAYRYRASGSVANREHFAADAALLMRTELTGADPFIVEIGCNDGVMLESLARAGVRHLGVEPAVGAAEVARSKGISVRTTFFDKAAAADIRAEHGLADVIFGANTVCHIADLPSLLGAVDILLAPDGVFVFEDPYLDTILHGLAFDQIYDEHVFYFSAHSVRAMARRSAFELVDVAPVALHGGEIRYTLARRRDPTPAVAELLARERQRGLTEPETFERFAVAVHSVREELLRLLRELKAAGRTVIGYGAPAKAATVTNFCGIDTDLLAFVCDSTPGKQGRLLPGSHLPVLAPQAFTDSRPDYAVLFAWNHAQEIMVRERAFHDRGGRWIRYVPRVTVD